MTVIFLDYESRSRTHIDAGPYRYCIDPDFKPLILTYAIGNSPVRIAQNDLELFDAHEEIWSIPDPLYVAHNSGFDRVVMSTYKGLPEGTYMHPSEWVDTMVLAQCAGYPGSLDRLTKALKVSEKDATGKRLINLFAKPNRQGGWNDATTHPEDWAKFCAYAAQDTLAMRDAARLLPKQSDAERAVWIADQLVNDRGALVDLPMAQAAVLADADNKAAQRAEVIELTGVANPGSGPQMLAWFESVGNPLPDLTKDVVAFELTKDTIPPTVRRVLELRQELALASAPAKFKAALAMAGADGRVRGAAKYYGAHTGRWCLTGDHEVLTSSGWVRLDEWRGGKIACWNAATSGISFQKSNAVAFDYEGEMLRYDNTRVKQISTPDHRMPVLGKDGRFIAVTVEEMRNRRNYVAVRGFATNPAAISDGPLRVLVMTQADGHYTEDGQLRFHFAKARKIERCRHLLRRVGVPFVEDRRESGTTAITIPKRAMPLWLSMFRNKQWGPWLWDRNPTIFFEELALWDGYKSPNSPNSFQYSTTSKTNADMVQAFAHLSGLFARVLVRPQGRGGNDQWSASYVVNIWLAAPEGHTIREKPTTEQFSGKVYCAETKTGFFLVRRAGSVWVTGNSGRGIQLQNQPRASLGKREPLALLDLMSGFGASSVELKALVRPLLLGPLTVVDYSQIEARVIAWLAGEQWVLDAFKSGRDIYVETAKRMHMPDPTGKGRQSGKSAVLGFGYGGGPNAARNVGAKGSDEELEELVQMYRDANPKIRQFWYDLWDAFVKGGAVGRISVQRSKGVRRVRLPSGREIVYRGVVAKRVEKLSERTGRRYMAWDVISRHPTGKVVHQWHGTIAENVTQAAARDLLAGCLPVCEEQGIPVVAHIHDEIVAEGDHLDELTKIMLDAPSWADGLPVDADGHVVPRYTKDADSLCLRKSEHDAKGKH